MDFSKMLKGLKFSPRSQASLKREAALRVQLKNVQGALRAAEALAEQAQANIDRYSNLVSEGEIWAENLIPKAAAIARDGKERMAALAPKRDEIQRQIDSETNPSLAAAAARAKHQAALAELVLARLEFDGKIAQAAKALLDVLEKRAEMTEKMFQCAREIELSLGPDDLDGDRFQALNQSLAKAAEDDSGWVRWFLGEGQARETYKVQCEAFDLPETLVSANVFRRGDEVSIRAGELAKVHLNHIVRGGNFIEELPDGAFRAGARIEVHETDIERIVDSR